MGNAAARTAKAAIRDVAPRSPPQALQELALSRAPIDPIAAELAQQHSSPEKLVSVQRIMRSGPRAGPAVHEKNAVTLQNMKTFEGAIVDQPDRGIGARNFKLWQEMQLNPRILDTAAVISRSNTQLIAAQMAAGQLPPSTKLDGRHATQLSLPRPASAAPGGELVPIEQANALVPAGTTIDALLLQQPPPAGVVAWGPRPSENSPYDQLVLHNPDEEFMLSRNELVELFARHRADPSVWTPARLAELYATKPEWVEAILETAAPPIVCTVDGDLYGVFEVRPFEDLAHAVAAGSGPSASG